MTRRKLMWDSAVCQRHKQYILSSFCSNKWNLGLRALSLSLSLFKETSLPSAGIPKHTAYSSIELD